MRTSRGKCSTTSVRKQLFENFETDIVVIQTLNFFFFFIRPTIKIELFKSLPCICLPDLYSANHFNTGTLKTSLIS